MEERKTIVDHAVPSLPAAHPECVRKGEFRAFVGRVD